MISYIIPLLGSYFSSDLYQWYLWPMACLGLLFILPSFIRSLFSWR